MKGPGRSFHTLDKDLGRITNVEAAQMHAFRPVWRLGLGVLLITAGLILALGLAGRDPRFVGVGAGLVVAGWLGLSIGANDIANSLGPAVGAGAIRLLPGLLLVALAEIAGAALAGEAVTSRLATGIVNIALHDDGSTGQMVMLAALIGAAGWVTIATGANLPVSTSHSIVGAIAGAGLAAYGAAAVEWRALLVITSGWMVTPLISALLAGALLALLHLRVGEAPDRAAAARRWLPPMTGAMIGLFVAATVSLLPALAMPMPLALLPGLAAAVLTTWLARQKLDIALATHVGPRKPGMKLVLRVPLLLAAVMMGFAHGAGDAGNVAGPLVVILRPGQDGTVQIPWTLLAAAGASIALGALLFGRRLVHMVAGGITRLNAVRAFCITLATALIVLGAAVFGLPVSSTHVAIGGIFGVGFVREWLDRRDKRHRDIMPVVEHRRRQLIRRSHVATITVAWLVTVPLTALIGAVTYLLIRVVI